MGDLLTALAAAQPDKIAIIGERTGVTGTDDVRTMTYAEFEDRTNQLVHVVDGLGVGPGDKIVWCGQNSTGILELTSASLRRGVPLHLRPQEGHDHLGRDEHPSGRDRGVKAHSREHLANYEIPRSISWLDELPKTGSGKILERDLRTPCWEGRTSNV